MTHSAAPIRRYPLMILLGMLLSLTPACTRDTPRQVAGGSPAEGRAALRNYGCGACHTIPGVRGADGKSAPPLTAFAERAFVAGVIGNSSESLVAWIMDPTAINPMTAMPNLGVPEVQARHMAAYLYTLR
jgi:cytochrome c